jgi:Suppressor of fused protein (SUFU)
LSGSLLKKFILQLLLKIKPLKKRILEKQILKPSAMLNFIKKLFGIQDKRVNQPLNEFSEEEYEKDYELKSQGLENVLGKMHDLVGHASIPFAVGGAVDMYYFPNHIKGTGFATMELLEPDGTGPLPNRLGTYELVAFTKHDCKTSDNSQTPFNLIERQVCGFFTTIGFFSRQAVLNPNETCEVPNGKGEETTCVVFDLYQPNNKEFKIGDRIHHLLLCLQVFRSEMEFSRANGSNELFKKLKEAGHYPYSDLDRRPVA